MEKLLTDEEKIYLRRTSNYLGSLGMGFGDIEFELEPWEDSINYDSVDWSYITHFSNNYRADIPPGLILIIQKIIKYASDNELFSDNISDVDETSWQKFEITIIRENNTISLNHFWNYYDTEDGGSVYYDDEEENGFFTEWINSGVFNNIQIPEDGILSINYNGSGDDGYIESQFNENNAEIPLNVENWCYSELEKNFGGWEINEGSFGEFIFDFNNKNVELNHTNNIERDGSDILWEENFGKNE